MAPPGFEKSSLGPALNLKNKQIYLAQMPANFDVKKAAFKSETEVVSDGVSYFVSSSAKLAPCQILNEQENGEYKVSNAQLTGLLAFTQKVQIPKPDYSRVHKPKQRVKQRTGLQMRHFATGYDRSDFGLPSSTDAKAPKAPKAKAPKAPKAPKASKETKEAKETKETKEPKEIKEPKETKETKEIEGTEEPKETKRKHKHKDSEGRKKRRKERKSDQ